uniref:8.9 kDa family member n=1 Tax=Rhipicephalus appendiculatus TaxID=34631 RepID=A0A131Z2J7_RHIAP
MVQVPNVKVQPRIMTTALVILFAACAASVVGQFYDPRCPQREHRHGCDFLGRIIGRGLTVSLRIPCLRVTCHPDGSVTSIGCPREAGSNPHPGAPPTRGVWPQCCDMCG